MFISIVRICRPDETRCELHLKRFRREHVLSSVLSDDRVLPEVARFSVGVSALSTVDVNNVIEFQAPFKHSSYNIKDRLCLNSMEFEDSTRFSVGQFFWKFPKGHGETAIQRRARGT